MDVPRVVHIRNFEQSLHGLPVDGAALICRLQENERHLKFHGISPRPLTDPAGQCLPIHAHAEAVLELELAVSGIFPAMLVCGEGLLESFPHAGRKTLALSHAPKKFNQRVALFEALSASELEDVWDVFEDLKLRGGAGPCSEALHVKLGNVLF